MCAVPVKPTSITMPTRMMPNGTSTSSGMPMIETTSARIVTTTQARTGSRPAVRPARTHRFGGNARRDLLNGALGDRRHDQRKQNEHQHADESGRETPDTRRQRPEQHVADVDAVQADRLTIGADSDLVHLAEHLRLRIPFEGAANSRHFAANDGMRSERSPPMTATTSPVTSPSTLTYRRSPPRHPRRVHSARRLLPRHRS